MAASAALAAQEPRNDCSVVGFKNGQAGVEQLAFGDDDDVEAWRELVTTKNLSYQSFSAISDHGAAQLAGRGNSQPARSALIAHHEHRAVAAMDAGAALVHLLKFRAATEAFGRTKR